MLAALTLTLALEGACSLAGDGDVAHCQRIYTASRAVALALPRYSFATDGKTAEHGLAWEADFDIPREIWPRFFSLGETPDASRWNVGRGEGPFEVSTAIGLAWYPGTGRVEGRALFRLRLASLPYPDSPLHSAVHLFAGLGGFYDRDGLGPRIELKLRVGHVAWGGVTLGVGYQPHFDKAIATGDVSLGFEAPWVWWW